jgi:CobQ-like glutamine amidotransferase family enzyme
MSDRPAGTGGPGSDSPGSDADGQPGGGRRGRHAASADVTETLILPAQRWPADNVQIPAEPAEPAEPTRRPSGRHASRPATESGPAGAAPAEIAAAADSPADIPSASLPSAGVRSGDVPSADMPPSRPLPAVALVPAVILSDPAASNGNGRRGSAIRNGSAPRNGTAPRNGNGSTAGSRAGAASPAGHIPPAERLARPAAARSDNCLRVVWVYPDLLSTYGDRGNLLVLSRRARLRGIDVEPVEVNSDQNVPADGDIYLLGGGEDLPQILAANRLRTDGGLAAGVSRGAVVFAVCAGYQLLGHEFGGVEGERVDGLGLLDISSGRGDRRGVGELVADVDPALGVPRLSGFENHQGVTRLGPGARPLARVSLGTGNGDGTEGAYAGKVLGTYMHGPALARNPGLADLLLSWAAGGLRPLAPEDEEWASQLRAERLAAVAQ